MKSLARAWGIVVAGTVVAALGSCQHGSDAPPTGSDLYRADIVMLCDSLHLSHADQEPKEQQWATQAIWLARATKTEAAHEFFVKIKPLEGDARARALDDEARRVGLDRCALASEWRQ
jgi:hypothetical protein